MTDFQDKQKGTTGHETRETSENVETLIPDITRPHKLTVSLTEGDKDGVKKFLSPLPFIVLEVSSFRNGKEYEKVRSHPGPRTRSPHF